MDFSVVFFSVFFFFFFFLCVCVCFLFFFRSQCQYWFYMYTQSMVGFVEIASGHLFGNIRTLGALYITIISYLPFLLLRVDFHS